MSEPEDSVASTTSTPRASPLIRRLRRGKFCFRGGVPERELGDDAPSRGDLVRELAIARRIDAVGTGADDRDAAAGAVERAACAAASMPSASPETMVRPAADSAAPNASALSLPCGVALRLPTIANAGRARSSRRPTQ